MQYKLSILIPARSEEFLKNTVENILENKESKTEIIVGLDGKWSNPPLVQHQDVNIIYVPKSLGQRGITNLCAKLSRAKYVLKLDAHCSIDKGMDRKMIEFMEKVGDNVTAVPVMRNLHAYDWVCECGERKYQDKGGICDKCGKQMIKDLKWCGKERPQSTSYCFDSEPHFQYFNEYSKRPEVRKQAKETGFTETMSLQGSCFMATRENYWKWELCDESLGSWGSQGIELCLKTRTLGKNILVNRSTWYSHMFRTKAVNDFGFPYPQSGRDVQRTKRNVKNLFWTNSWNKQIYPLSKVIEQFMPIPGWSEESIGKLKEDEMKVERPGIYSIKNASSGKIYIGSATNLARRFGEHLRMLHRKDHDNKYLQSAWNRYRGKGFTFNIEYFCKEEDLIKHEQNFIDFHKKRIGWRKMYNLNPIAGSSLGRKHRPDSIAKMSKQQSGEGNGFYGKKHTEESIQKMKDNHKGSIPWNKDKPWSDEVKKKISIANTGTTGWNKGLTKETDKRVKKYADKLVGRKLSKEHKKKLIKANTGKKLSEETKKKIGIASSNTPRTKEWNRKNSEALKQYWLTKRKNV